MLQERPCGRENTLTLLTGEEGRLLEHCLSWLGLHSHTWLLPPSVVPYGPSPQLDEARARVALDAVLGCPVSRGGGSVAYVEGLGFGPAAALFVLNKGQDVSQGEGPAALSTGEQVPCLWGSRELGDRGLILTRDITVNSVSDILNCTQVLRSASKFSPGHRSGGSAVSLLVTNSSKQQEAFKSYNWISNPCATNG